MILYTCLNSRGLRASWTAAELGIDLELRMLPFPPRARAKEYFEINPLGTVPMLVDGDIRMTESCAIAHYIATRSGPTALAPAPGETGYADYLDFLHYGEATITFPQTVYIRFALMERAKGLAAAGEAYAEWFAQRLEKSDTRLADREYLCGDRFTVADISVGYALHLSTLTRLDHHLTPRLRNYLDRLRDRAGFKQALARERAAAEAQGIA